METEPAGVCAGRPPGLGARHPSCGNVIGVERKSDARELAIAPFGHGLQSICAVLSIPVRHSEPSHVAANARSLLLHWEVSTDTGLEKHVEISARFCPPDTLRSVGKAPAGCAGDELPEQLNGTAAA
ncbi:hypothetical protein Anapl_13504 [Anas platyrhynchos]|uniref:Uncharacterized protein n=1 Tax=Anas platyrhynchos TaxID=8839 RepID=R0KXP0_ANAPL|nr:hypothetical protein Anapl_13504 [Anas platyrhynchos]